MSSTEHEPIVRVWGRAQAAAEPLVRGLVGKASMKLIAL